MPNRAVTSPADKIWMSEALRLAELGRGRVSPNPLVGAVVVRKGRLIARGFHAYFGGPHAEVTALRKAGPGAQGATLYVTLEPCSSWGKTPPCVDEVIASRVARVVIGSRDPNPENFGKGISKLKKAGLKVQTGILTREVERQNQAFFKAMKTGLPFVTLKMAQSLDGKIATPTGESRWISSPASRRFVHRLRSEVDAVLVGKNTALKDNPRLQGINGSEKPWRIVLDPHLESSQTARFFQGQQLTFVAVSEKRLKTPSPFPLPLKGGEGKGEEVCKGRIFIPVSEKERRLELKDLLRKLTSLGVHHLLVEGGGEVAWSLIRERLVDRLIWIVAPKIIGGRSAKTSVEGEGIAKLKKAFPLRWERVYRLDEDWVFECLPAS